MHPRDSAATYLLVTEWLLLFQTLPSMPEEFGSEGVPIPQERTSSLSNLPQKTSIYISWARHNHVTGSGKTEKVHILLSSLCGEKQQGRKDWEQLFHS